MTVRSWARRFVLAAGALLSLSLPVALGAQDLACDPGEPEVRRLRFVGNRAFGDDELSLAVATTASDWLRRSTRRLGERRCLDREELPRDSLRLTIFYKRHGYYRAQVRYEVRPSGERAVEMRFIIEEREPVILTSFVVEGLDSVPNAAAITRDLPLREGDAFDRFALDTVALLVERRLRNSGYPQAQILQSFSVDTAALSGSASITAATGPRARIARIEVTVDTSRQEQQIPDRVVRRLLGFGPGALYRDRSLIAAQRTLYQSEAYQHVEVRLAPDSVHPSDDSVVVLVNLREGQMRAARVGAGWASLDCFRAQGQFTHYNFLRRAQRLELNARISKLGVGYPFAGAEWACTQDARNDEFSDTVNYYAGATFRQPRLLGFRYVPTVTVFSERRSEFQAYLRETPIGGVASATRDAGIRTPVSFSYSLERGRTRAQPALFCAVFNICTSRDRDQVQNLQRLAVASAEIARDRSDNTLNPTRGWTARLQARHASRFIGSDPDLAFNKLTGDASWYHPLGDNIFAARLRLGAVLGSQISLAGARSFIPPQERLYAGGATTVRGFRQSELGPTAYIVDRFIVERDAGLDSFYVADTSQREVARTVPIGGNSLVVGNLEYRMRSPFFPEIVQLVAFTDFGEVWNRGREGLDFRQLKWTPGAGIRVFTLVGAIRVDIGYNPYDKPPGAAYYEGPIDAATGIAPFYCVSPGNRLAVEPDPAGPTAPPVQSPGTCPSTFSPVAETSFFRRLNFNFSIGQAF